MAKKADPLKQLASKLDAAKKARDKTAAKHAEAAACLAECNKAVEEAYEALLAHHCPPCHPEAAPTSEPEPTETAE